MFYIKCNGKKINLREDNIYTKCPTCGKEIVFDIWGKADLDPYSTSVYCKPCSKKLKQGQVATAE